MLRVTLKGVRGHLVRFLLTACAVMIGVSFVAGTFVLRDSIDSTLTGLFSQASKGVDVQVRGKATDTQNRGGSSAAPLPLTLESTLASAAGVQTVLPDLQGSALIAGKDGTVVRNGGAPGLGFAYDPRNEGFTLVDGTAPSGPNQVLVEKATLDKSGLKVGDATKAVIGGTVRDVTVSGVVGFGSGTLFGATAILLDDASARQAFAPDGVVSSFSVKAVPGVSQDQLKANLDRVLPAGAESVTAKTLNDDAQSTLKTALGFVTTFLLVFAGIALFVGSFIIVNTFSMLVAQRTRELALLRAVGASRPQIRRVVLGEAAVIGFVGSVLGIGLGVLVAAAAKAALRTFIGVDLSQDLPLTTSTVVVSVLVGTVVTLLAALLPAWRASRIPPVAAMRDDITVKPKGLRRRGTIGVALLAVGSAALAWAVTLDDVNWPVVGLGAALGFAGILVAAPLGTRPVVRLVTAPFVLVSGVVGKLARENALRVPRRTATTASALMIGLILISAVSVVAQSAKASVYDIVAQEITADFVVDGGGSSTVPTGVVADLRKVAGVRSVDPAGGVGIKVKDVDDFAYALSSAGLTDNIKVDFVSGSAAALDKGEVLVSESTARREGWTTGTTLTDAAVGSLAGQTLTVGGVYKDIQILATGFIVGRDLFEKAVPAGQRSEFLAYVRTEPGADIATVKAGLTDVVKQYLVVSVNTGEEYRTSAASGIDTILGLLYVLLLFSVIVAVLGIVNTLALSVFERTREIGLLRAVGLRRRQLSGMITIEAVATALFGALLGTAFGLGLGIALQHGFASTGLDTLSIPWGTIITVLVVSGVVGVLAAALPAIRAVRLNILGAIATE